MYFTIMYVCVCVCVREREREKERERKYILRSSKGSRKLFSVLV